MTYRKYSVPSNPGKICNSIISCSEAKRMVFEKKGYRIMECEKCGHRFLPDLDQKNHVHVNFSDDYFFGGGDGYPNYLEQKHILLHYGIRYAQIVSKYTKPGKMLDVGSAAGFILKGFQQSGWDCYGVEPNDRVANYGRSELGLNITTGSLESYNGTSGFKLISIIQVIGHLYDIDSALKNVVRLISSDGLLLIESWNMRSFVARILGKGWHEYSPPSVVHWFSDKTLEQLLRYYGFEIVSKGYPAKKINVHHALSFMEGKLPAKSFKRKLLRMMDKVGGNLNLNYPPIDLKWYLFQKIRSDSQSGK